MPDDSTLADNIKSFHGEEMEREFCLGEECPKKNCRICPAAGKAKFVLDVTDRYRQSIKEGYYTTTIKEVVDPITGEKKYVYTRPG